MTDTPSIPGNETVPAGAVRWSIYEAHNRQCFYCGQPLQYVDMEVDHIVPRSLNGQNLAHALRDLHLPENWDVQGLQNLVPACRTCNRRKRDLLALPAQTMFLLTIANARVATVAKLAKRYKRQAEADKLHALIEQALAGGLNPREFFPRAVGVRNALQLTGTIAFADLAIGDVRAENVEELRQRRLGTTAIDMEFKDRTRQSVATVAEYDAARDAGAYPATATDLRCEGTYKNASAVFHALASALQPAESYISSPHVGVCDIALLPSSLIMILGMPDLWKPYLERMPTVGDMVSEGVLSVKAVSSVFITLSPTIAIPDVAVMQTNIWELLRADLSGDGVEDMLVAVYGRTVGGSHGYSREPVILGRHSSDSVLEVLVMSPRHSAL